MDRYKLLSGELIHLGGVGAHEQTFLRSLQKMAKAGVSFFEIERVAIGSGSPALQGWGRVTREIVSSPLYRVAADIATRAGIAEGLMLAPEHEGKRKEIPADRSLMSVTQAATTLGISRAAVHKAIQQKRLAAQRYGNVLLVSREAVLDYKQGRVQRERAPSRRRGHGPGERPRRPALAAQGR
jgi:excisionase family DNA binding protein